MTLDTVDINKITVYKYGLIRIDQIENALIVNNEEIVINITRTNFTNIDSLHFIRSHRND